MFGLFIYPTPCFIVNNELIFLLIFDVLALSFAVWWLSRRVKSKIIEVNERKSKRWTREEE